MARGTINTINTNTVEKAMGENMRKARNALNMTQQELADILSVHPQRPITKSEPEDVKIDRLRKWEYGENPISLEWLPAICDTLKCDIGYLFGDYEAKKREVSDVMAVTGLSEKAVATLKHLQEYNTRTWYMDVLNLILENENVVEFLAAATDYCDHDEDVGLVGEFVTANIRTAKRSEISAFTCQRLLSKMLDDARCDIHQKMDYRPLYSFVYGLRKEGEISAEQMERYLSKLDSGDVSEIVGDINAKT